jgi:hypothetical protein
MSMSMFNRLIIWSPDKDNLSNIINKIKTKNGCLIGDEGLVIDDDVQFNMNSGRKIKETLFKELSIPTPVENVFFEEIFYFVRVGEIFGLDNDDAKKMADDWCIGPKEHFKSLFSKNTNINSFCSIYIMEANFTMWGWWSGTNKQNYDFATPRKSRRWTKFASKVELWTDFSPVAPDPGSSINWQ